MLYEIGKKDKICFRRLGADTPPSRADQSRSTLMGADQNRPIFYNFNRRRSARIGADRRGSAPTDLNRRRVVVGAD